MNKKNNGNRGVSWQGLGFGFLLGIWFSQFLLSMGQGHHLIEFSVFGIAVCFLGFLHFYTKVGAMKTMKTGDDGKEVKPGLLERARVWDK